MGRKPSSLKLKLRSETLRNLSGQDLAHIAGGSLVTTWTVNCTTQIDSQCPGCEPGDTVDGIENPTARRTCQSCGC